MVVDVVGVLVAGSAAGALVSGVLAAGAWRDRTMPGTGPFAWLMVAAVGWCLLNVAWLTTADPAVATAVFLLTRLVSGLIVGLWVVFALSYTGREALFTRARLVALLLVPTLYSLLALTNPLHGLVTADVTQVMVADVTLFVGETGPVYLAQTALQVGFIATGYALFGEFLLRSRNLYRTQTFVILTAGLLTAGVQGLFVLGATPHPGLDITPLTFALNGGLVGVALLRSDFVSVTPLAGDLLVDELPDPVLALDTDERIIDYNAAATALFGTDDLGSRPVDDVSPGLLDDIERDEVFALGEPLSYYDPRTSAITDQHGGRRGRLVVLREVTGQQRRQDRLEALQAATRQFVEASQPETVAELTVRFATRVLDQNAAAVFLADDGALEAAAVSDGVGRAADELTIDPERTPDHELWRTYESGESRIADCFGLGTAMERALMVPMGDHGVVAIASADDSYATEDRQYASILAQTTQVALEQLQRQRELRESRISIERRNEQIEFFNGVLRHSLRNAMVVVQGRADYLRDSVGAEEEHHIDSITEWCARLTEMSDAIKDINETVSASESERLDAISLSAAVEGSLERAVDRDADVTVDVELADERVVANHLAEEVLTSVVENAVEHNTSDRPRVEIDTRHAGDWIQVRVADNGPGISDELKTTMFERSISNDQTAGGFGLYFVSVMMDLYGGKVWYEDNDPRGAVAILEFQRADAERDATAADATASTTEAQTKSHDD
ncbi:histidine kinase N-terminal 7TM domain-containing protein [Haloarcula onubensis]|uniref:ATP-binding protein n=1 Tax=Haloarcula onubensis TaxID=2950539 RepID=A0ABU2FSE6_9EURY|nr:histidine kinase N-terminal 7TM domain-containing protein [Halomicroarcula sp. S3CR25-11]MDS0283683.1 ATP-binding protein [Halomicroarcula sp. S3CR25-11]